jgi:hypothetical protein
MLEAQEPSDRSGHGCGENNGEDRGGYVKMADANIHLLFPAQARPGRAGTPPTPPFCFEICCCFIVTLSGSPLLQLVQIPPDQSVIHIMVFCCAFR